MSALEDDSTNWMFYKIMEVMYHIEIATTSIGSQLTDLERKRKAEGLQRLKSDSDSVKKVKTVKRSLFQEDPCMTPSKSSAISEFFNQSPSGLFKIESITASVKIQVTPEVRTQVTDTLNLAAVVSVGTMTRKYDFEIKD
ncbi:hypothetical protein NQ317_003068 [Molorchus minor]|uniref:Uncharacterized protein n=1 Tax=Molorchus minor TaxID=1323400 RepID=A0ABQ9J3E4_9CUCU|nr:hypothetical protein NQ317_003068 [Molorchus minor]